MPKADNNEHTTKTSHFGGLSSCNKTTLIQFNPASTFKTSKEFSKCFSNPTHNGMVQVFRNNILVI